MCRTPWLSTSCTGCCCGTEKSISFSSLLSVLKLLELWYCPWRHLEHCGGLFSNCVWLTVIVSILSAVRDCLDTPHLFFLFRTVEYQERLACTRHSRLDKTYYFLSENLGFVMACFVVWQIVMLLSNAHSA